MEQKHFSQICRELVRFSSSEDDVRETLVALQNADWSLLFVERAQLVERKTQIKKEREIERAKVRPPRKRRKAQIIEEQEGKASELRKLPYVEYLKTPEWKKTALRALKYANFRCQICNISSKEALLNVHHRTYERLGCEKMSDLIVLCKEHHELFHMTGKLVKDKKEQ